MGDIFRKADRVVSWLGEEDDRSGDTMEFMSKLGEVTKNDRLLAPLVLDFFRKFFHMDVAVSQAKFLLRPYWKRMWIVQEMPWVAKRVSQSAAPGAFRGRPCFDVAKSLTLA